MREKLSAETRLLLYAAKTSLTEADSQNISQLLKGGLNWQYLLEAAARHQVSALLYHQLKKIEDGRFVPPGVMKKLAQAHHRNYFLNKKSYRQLKRILKIFSTAGIPVMILKGMALAELVYQDVSLREMMDIDLLVHEENFAQIRDKLSHIGYTLQNSIQHLRAEVVVDYAHYFSQLRFFQQQHVPLEVHFRLLNFGVVTSEIIPVWQNAVPTKIAGINTLIPAPEDFLLHLCIHANLHNYCSLKLFCDIAELIRHYGEKLSWERFLEYVDRLAIRTSIYYTLYFTQELTQVQIQGDILNELRPPYFSGKVFELLWHRSKVLQLQKRQRPHDTEAPIYYLLEMDSLKNKLFYLFKILFPPISWLSYRYGQPPSKKLYFSHLFSTLKKLFAFITD